MDITPDLTTSHSTEFQFVPCTEETPASDGPTALSSSYVPSCALTSRNKLESRVSLADVIFGTEVDQPCTLECRRSDTIPLPGPAFPRTFQESPSYKGHCGPASRFPISSLSALYILVSRRTHAGPQEGDSPHFPYAMHHQTCGGVGRGGHEKLHPECQDVARDVQGQFAKRGSGSLSMVQAR